MSKDIEDILPPGTPILSMDDPDFVAKFREAIGAKPGERIEIVGPQFEREDGVQVPAPNDLGWSKLATLPAATLLALGLRRWSEPDANGMVLWLLPYQFYDHIPEGLELGCIDGTTEKFQRGVTDNDYRGGVLAYGIQRLETSADTLSRNSDPAAQNGG